VTFALNRESLVKFNRDDLGRRLTILAVEEVTHRLSPSFVRFHQRPAFGGVHALLRYGVNLFGFAALRAAIGKTGFIRLQFELFRANDAQLDRKCHSGNRIPTHTLELQKTQIRQIGRAQVHF